MTVFNKKFKLAKHYACCTFTVASFCSLSTALRAAEMTSANQKQLNSASIKYSTKGTVIAPVSKTAIEKNYSLTTIKSFAAQNPVEEKTRFFLPRPTQDLSSRVSPQTIAQTNQIPNRSNVSPKKSRRELPSRFYIGPDFLHRDYNEEEITPGFKSHEFGTLFGLQATYDYVKAKAVYVGVGFRYGGGQTTYDGSLQDGTPATSTTDNRFLNIEGRLGYTFQVGREGRFLFSPFVGLGYHNWNRDISDNITITGEGSIQGVNTIETYSWGYVGPGFHAEYKVSPKFDIGLNAKLMVMLGGRIKVEDKFQGETFDQGSGDLGNTLQYEVEVPLTFHLVERPQTGIDLKITPFYRNQNISRGKTFDLDSGDFAVEPASTTSVYGVTAGIQFRF
jgi:hypothetical protein